MSNKRTIRVLHIIDSLNAGGAEQMAVNMVNGLAKKELFTCLLVTRTKGLLESRVNKNVTTYILEKKNATDIKSFMRMFKIIRQNNINIIHAHSTSIVWASFLKVLIPNIKLIWHDHYGNSEHLESRPASLLGILSKLWSHVIPVNDKLKNWSIDQLGVKKEKISFLNNFAGFQHDNIIIKELEDPKFRNAINIINIANLRPQKDHLNLLQAFTIAAGNRNDIVLHLIGENPNTAYSANVLKTIKEHTFSNRIYYWGAQQEIGSWLGNMQLGVISSISEGLPVSLLEYGLAGINVIATNVGQINDVLGNGKFGTIVPPSEPNLLASAILDTIDKQNESSIKSILFKEQIELNYSEDTIVDKLIDIYRNCLES